MRQLFISDLHLDETLDHLSKGFFKFLDVHCQDADELYILGDFFEVWLGDDHDTTFNKAISQALSALTADVYIMHGNRDFLIGEVFCQSAGATLLNDPTVIETGAGPALLLHGDSLCTLDAAYMQARDTLRSEAFKADFLSRSIEERQAYARQLRGESNAHTRETSDDIMDVTPHEVVNAMSSSGTTLMIHGHTHRPAVHHLEVDGSAAERYVLGDWHKSMKYLVIEDGSKSLEQFSLQG